MVQAHDANTTKQGHRQPTPTTQADIASDHFARRGNITLKLSMLITLEFDSYV